MPAENKLTFFLSENPAPTTRDENAASGFPSPAADYAQEGIDLNKALSENPLATFYVRVEGNAMAGAGIDDKDILVIDRSLDARKGSLAVCFLNGEFTVRRINPDQGKLWILPESKKENPIAAHEDPAFQLWGIVIYVIKKVR